MTAHWGISDPAAVQGGDDDRRRAFFRAFNELQNRLSILVSLPISKLDRLTLQRKLDDIGRLGHAGADALPGSPPRSGAGDQSPAQPV